ncbi:PAS domain S-box protein [Fodinibius salsisoli]|uniref:histidine kinase n=1 Tax=Fodinibius salsisoli TaxID=2820877 RepID=A0ABT3PKJ9_9BACT|nr:PAS domain S-box protein [Fodinibius salsisoli]MCW9706451.1 PAS domain S-box protein [Fodinibius salsisoli]
MAKNGTSYLSKTAIFILDDQSLQILDANEQALQLYGYCYDELCHMSVHDLGTKRKRAELISQNGGGATDNIWHHQKKSGEVLYVQFTHHRFNYEGKPAKFAVIHDVTEQIEHREERGSKYPRLKSHNINYPLAEVGFDENLEITHWSEKAEELFGWSEEEVLGEAGIIQRILPEDKYRAAQKRLNKIVDEGKSYYTAEGQFITKSGNVYYGKSYNSMLYGTSGNLISVHSLISDITKRKESQDLFRALSEESLVGVYLIQDGIFKYINPRFAEIFGYKEEEIEGKVGPVELTHPDDRDRVKKNLSIRIEGDQDSVEYGFRCITKDAETIHVHVYGSVIEYGGSKAIVGTLVDITRNNKIIKQYKASLESYQDLFDSISDAIFIQGEEGEFLEVNKAVEEMYGYHRDELIGESPHMLSDGEKVDLDKIQKYAQEAMKGHSPHFEWWGKDKDGECFPLEVIINPAKFFGKDAMITIARDISERYKAEEQMRKSEEMFRQLFQNAPIAIALMDSNHMVQQVNESFTNIFGYQTHEIQGQNIDEVIVPDEEKSMAYKVSEKIFDGKTARTSGLRKDKDGRIINVLIYGVPVIVEEKTIAIYGLYIDITESKKNENQLKQSLKEKKVLLSEIHHRVKNNLAVIMGLLELQSFNTTSDEASKVLKESQMRINSIALIHEKLYQKEDLSEISFDVYIKQLMDVIVSSLQTNQQEIQIDIEAASVHLTVGQAIPCGLILNELITNAYKHAFEDQRKGKILVSFTQEEDVVTLLVKDNGKGMSDAPNLENPDSLGIQLINTLADQLQGSAKFSNAHPGTAFKLRFTIEY